MVIFSSFYNEEYLLPWWLEHHKKIFKHGVLFNYFSTDKSVDIIKKICPTWEVRDTINKDWDFFDNDSEFMRAEREFADYKMVLTTTEFLVGKLPKLEYQPTAYAAKIFRLVDNEPEKKPTYDKSLVEQKNFGFIDKSKKRRFLHNFPDGRYDVGRHSTRLGTTDIPIFVFKYVYSPWNEEFIKRKLQMRDYVNPENIKGRWGLHHVWDRKKMEEEYQRALNSEEVIYL
jgi:hypothetical protein